MAKIIRALNEEMPDLGPIAKAGKDSSVRAHYSEAYLPLFRPFNSGAVARALKSIREQRRPNKHSRKGLGGRVSSPESAILYVVIHYWMNFDQLEVFNKLKDLPLTYYPLKPVPHKQILVTLPHSFYNWLKGLAKISGAQVLEVMAALLAGYVKYNPNSLLLAESTNSPLPPLSFTERYQVEGKGGQQAIFERAVAYNADGTVMTCVDI